MTDKLSSAIAETQTKAGHIVEAPNERRQHGLSAVLDSGQWARHALKAGDYAIEFCLPDRQGKKVSLAKSLLSGPVMLIVSQGGCHDNVRTQLLDLAAVYPQMRSRSVTLIVLAPRWDIADIDELPFATLVDSHCSVATVYGLALQGGGPTRPHAESIGGGETDADLAEPLVLPATYVISRSGEIVFASIDANAAHYLQPVALLRMLEALSRRQDF